MNDPTGWEDLRELVSRPHMPTVLLDSSRLKRLLDELAAARAGAGEADAQIAHLELLTKQLREQGDVRQVMLHEDGVDDAPTLADELWLIAYNLRAALSGDPA